MRRAIFPALLAIAMMAFSSANAQAFGLFDCFDHHNDACCDVVAEPACGVEAPMCGAEVVEPCCDAPKHGLLHRLFHGDRGCDACCGEILEPACGLEAPIVEPSCGCGAPAPCDCGAGCGGHDRPLGGFFHNLLHHRGDHGCDACCGEIVEPACGLEVAPSCGCGA